MIENGTMKIERAFLLHQSREINPNNINSSPFPADSHGLPSDKNVQCQSRDVIMHNGENIKHEYSMTLLNFCCMLSFG